MNLSGPSSYGIYINAEYVFDFFRNNFHWSDHVLVAIDNGSKHMHSWMRSLAILCNLVCANNKHERLHSAYIIWILDLSRVLLGSCYFPLISHVKVFIIDLHSSVQSVIIRALLVSCFVKCDSYVYLSKHKWYVTSLFSFNLNAKRSIYYQPSGFFYSNYTNYRKAFSTFTFRTCISAMNVASDVKCLFQTDETYI